jgi:hypothetical protein
VDHATASDTFWVATYTPNAGADEESNTGHSCFGRTVLVRLVWKDASFSNGGIRGGPERPNAQLVTADATSGTVSFMGATYGAAAADPEPGEVYLYGPRKDLDPK